MSKIVLTDLATAPGNAELYRRLKTPAERYRFLCKAMTPHDVRRLKALVYPNFLRTLYWSIIREQVIASAGGKCSGCGTVTSSIDVHHKDYRYQGEEYRSMDCLTPLCRSCHASGHAQKQVRTAQDGIKALIDRLGLRHKQEVKKPDKRNRNYDPRTLMNLHTYGDIRGYQGGGDGAV